MFRRFPTFPDQLTLLRLILAPPLWVLALLQLRTALGIGIAVAGLTDVLDGYFARRMRKTTRLGSQLDSVADMVMVSSITIWLVLLRPDFFRVYGRVLLVWAVLGVVTLIVGWVRFRRLANLHLYSAKVSGVIGYLFVVYLMMFDGLNAVFFWVAMTAAFFGTTETLLVMLTRSRVDEHAGTILRPRPRVPEVR